MSADPTAISSSQRVGDALQCVQTEAEYAPAADAAIVPLFDLLGGFPIDLGAVPGLNYREAARVITGDGRDVPPLANPDQPLAGLLYAHTDKGVPSATILVQPDALVERRRFTVAHELGHFLMHFRPFVQPGQPDAVLLEGLSATDEEALDDPAEAATVTVLPVQMDRAQMEREANAFAAALLMPEDACCTSYECYRARYGEHRNVLARRMATDFLVSRTAMFWRLTNLGLGVTA